jgi:hypothetical protein
MTATDRWNNRSPVAWEGKIPGDDRLFRAIIVDDKTVIAQYLADDKWLVVGEGSKDDLESGKDEGVADLVMEQAVADVGSALIRAVSKRKFQIYCYDGSKEFLDLCKELGVENGSTVELTPEQVLDLSHKVAIMITPNRDIQVLRLDSPRWRFQPR